MDSGVGSHLWLLMLTLMSDEDLHSGWNNMHGVQEKGYLYSPDPHCHVNGTSIKNMLYRKNDGHKNLGPLDDFCPMVLTWKYIREGKYLLIVVRNHGDMTEARSSNELIKILWTVIIRLTPCINKSLDAREEYIYQWVGHKFSEIEGFLGAGPRILNELTKRGNQYLNR